MGLTRRQFLQLTGAAAGAVAFVGCSPPQRELQVQSPVRLPEDLVTGIDNWYASVCRMCPAGCGIIVRIMEGRAKKIEGNPDYPVNRGKLCARGQAGLQVLYHPDRIRGPLRRKGDRGGGLFEETSWDDALGELAAKLSDPTVAGAAGSILLLTSPDRGHLGLALQRFTQASNSLQVRTFIPLTEMPAAQAPAGQTAGSAVPAVTTPLFDIANARVILSFGADFLNAGVAPVQYGVAYGQFRSRPGARGVLVQIEPRITSTGASADRWVPIRPGSEGYLALAMARVIIEDQRGDPAVSSELDAATRSFRPADVVEVTGVSVERIVDLARRFVAQTPSVAIAGGPAVAHTNGRFNLDAINALNRLAGSFGKPGGVLTNPGPALNGLPSALAGMPLSEWQQRIAAQRAGQGPRVLLLRGVNPVYGLPASLGWREALDQVPYIVSFSNFVDESTALADLVLPVHTYLEDWGSDVPDPGPGFQVVGFQQPVVNPIYDTRSFGDVLLTLASQTGFSSAVPWRTMKDVLREGVGGLMQLRRGSVQAPGIEEFWVRTLQRGGWWDEGNRASAAPAAPAAAIQPSAPTFAGVEQDFPFHLLPFPSNGLGAGEGAHVPWLQATPDPVTTAIWQTWVEMNMDTGHQMGLQEGDIVRVESPQGSLEAPVYLHPGIRPDTVAIPLGQGHTGYGRWARDRGANVLALLDTTMQTEGGLAWAATRVKVTKTGKDGRVSKAEGQVYAVEPPDEDLVQVIRQ